MDLEVVTIGDELLLGQVNDTNAPAISAAMAALGLRIVRHSTVGDTGEEISAAVSEAFERVNLVITTGGLGPTRDDITKNVVAELMGADLELDSGYLSELELRFAALGRSPMPASNRSQALMPRGAEIIPNPRGSAPGIWLTRGEKQVILLPGVPHEMRGILSEELVPLMADRFCTQNQPVTRTRTLRTASFGESALADHLERFEHDLPPLTLAYLPNSGGVDLRLTASAMDAAKAEELLGTAAANLEQELGENFYGREKTDIAEVVVDLLRGKGKTVAVAESCTGGILGGRITAIPGSSDVFLGGVIAYADSVKEGLLCVNQSDLRTFGAVSSQVAEAMAKGVAERFDAGVGVGVTGVAGPGGGSDGKPVGTVYISVWYGKEHRTGAYRFPGKRAWIRIRSAQEALNQIRLAVS